MLDKLHHALCDTHRRFTNYQEYAQWLRSHRYIKVMFCLIPQMH
jgi:hypothetical protein